VNIGKFNKRFHHELSDALTPTSVIIFGGGGFISNHWKWDKMITNVLEKFPDRPWVAWSIGTDCEPSHCRRAFTTLSGDMEYDWTKTPWMKSFGLVRIRDKMLTETYTTMLDASCLSEEFDREFQIKRKVGYIESGRESVKCERFVSDVFSNLPLEDILGHGANDEPRSLESIVEFIGESEVIVTATYHGLYWANLLGRKVIVCDSDISTEIMTFPYPFVTYSGNLESDIAEAEVIPNLLNITRSQNEDFMVLIQKYYENFETITKV